jgi:hypothetical protein
MCRGALNLFGNKFSVVLHTGPDCTRTVGPIVREEGCWQQNKLLVDVTKKCSMNRNLRRKHLPHVRRDLSQVHGGTIAANVPMGVRQSLQAAANQVHSCADHQATQGTNYSRASQRRSHGHHREARANRKGNAVARTDKTCSPSPTCSSTTSSTRSTPRPITS